MILCIQDSPLIGCVCKGCLKNPRLQIMIAQDFKT